MQAQMQSPLTGLRVAAVIFAIMAVVQLVRLVVQPVVMIGGHEVPLWPNALALIILGGLSYWMWSLSHDAMGR